MSGHLIREAQPRQAVSSPDRPQPFHPQPILITGVEVMLEPLGLQHVDDLHVAAAHAALWRWMPIPPPRERAQTAHWVQAALDAAARADEVPFAIVLRQTGRAIGSARFMDIARPHRRLEIGWTWLALEHQRTRANTEAKYLLLKHAFEDLGATRVQFKTDGRNERSQRALERIGAVREGVLRRHMTLWDGFVRDSVFFSILDQEWPRVRAALEARLNAPAPGLSA